MRKAETAMLRMANDQYRKVIFNSQIYYNTGAGTYEKAVDIATKDFLSRGINCIEYKNGARVNIASYAGMALRTANTRAYCQGEGAKRQEWGITTVIVNKRGLPCPKCGRWTGKILIDDVWSGGKASDGPYPLMSQAMAGGLYHPNCKDGHSTYFPGISEKPEKVTKKEMKQAVVAEQQENRKNLIQRNIDKFDRLSKYSLDDTNRKEYKLKVSNWEREKMAYKYPDSDEIMTTYDFRENVNKDVIKPHSIRKNMRKSEIGIEMLKYAEESNVKINLLYKADNPEGLMGYYDPFDDIINIHVDQTKTVEETSSTVIHELTHKRLGATNTRKEEVRCFINEHLHKNSKLTIDEVKNIIKSVDNNEYYKKLKWR